MKKFKRVLSPILAIGLTFSLIACGSSDETGTKQEGGEGDSSKGNEQITLKLQHIYTDGVAGAKTKILNQIIEDYEAANPHIKIEQDALLIDDQKMKLKTQAAANEIPDITMVNPGAQMAPFVEAGKFAPLNDILERDNLKDTFQPGVLDHFTFDGQVYSIPDGNNIGVIYYNKEIFEQNGLDVPQTFEEIIEHAKVLKSNGVIPFAIAEKQTWTGSWFFMNILIREAGTGFLQDVMDKKKTFMDPAFVRSVEKFQELIKAGGFQDGATAMEYSEAQNLFTTGKAAMYMMGTWATADLEPEGMEGKVGVFSLPTVDGKGDINEFMLAPATGFAVASGSNNLEEAKDFVHYYFTHFPQLSVENNNAVGMSQVIDADLESLGYSQLNIDTMELFSKVKGGDIAFDNTIEPITTQTHLTSLQNLFIADISPEDVAKEHQAAFEMNNP